ncbi:MAG: DUF3302 domain-containing protein [Burkholderiales bacterium]|nr:DUF3302 domain-containing protein [Burkholderiales bacterium]
MLGFELDFWDYATFVSLALAGVAFILIIVFVGGLPGRIAVSRKHPDAQAVTVMGWAGLLAVWPWMQAFIWAFKPTDKIDIRRFPREEAKAIDEEIARLKGEVPGVERTRAREERLATLAAGESAAGGPPANAGPDTKNEAT